jgi:hypothetical protein
MQKTKEFLDLLTIIRAEYYNKSWIPWGVGYENQPEKLEKKSYPSGRI